MELYDLDTGWISLFQERLLREESNVSHLTLTSGISSSAPHDDHRDGLRACLEFPRALVSLTLYVQGLTFRTIHGPVSYMIAHDELWQILCHHKSTLECLDVFDQDVALPRHIGPFASPQKTPFGKLKEFNRLTTLRVQPELLLGGIGRTPQAPYLLRDALPPHLRSLTLYRICHKSGLIDDASLQLQLIEILTEITDTLFNALEYLIIEDSYPDSFRDAYADGQREVFTRLCELQRVCRVRGVISYVMSGSLLPRGGHHLLRYPKAHNPEERARDLWNRGIDIFCTDTQANEWID